MRATGWLRRNRLEVACGAFVCANLAVIVAFPGIVRVPFFLTWIGLALVYGFRPWPMRATTLTVVVLSLAIAAALVLGGFRGHELWGRVDALPLLALLFAATAWHARRRHIAQEQLEAVAATRASLLERQAQFVYDASHELRTPVTIARGHLELLSRETDAPELAVALDELQRMGRIVDRLLLLAKAEQPDFLVLRDVDIEDFLADVFMRWSEVAPRAWRLDVDLTGVARVDPEAIRIALDALLENAVKYTEPRDAITLRGHALSGEIVIEVADEGAGVSEDALASIFDRFARADDARTRAQGGVGLGLAIVAAIARAHGGRCTVERRDGQTVFRLAFPVGVDLSGGAEELVLFGSDGGRVLAEEMPLDAVR
jgi:signal transduction histidine kinase